jgi:hypothetical protein
MDAETYLINIKVKLAVSSSVQSIEIIDERIVLSDLGYFRARLVLENNDFMEVSEYFVCENENCYPKTYRYQWMDPEQKKLIKRWDNAEHFPNLPGFPHHIHLGGGEEDNVKPSVPLNIIDLIDIIEAEIKESRGK